MITAVTWRGDLDGDVVLTSDEDGASRETVVDRPGDLVVQMQREFTRESLLEVAAAYGYCLASRGIEEPIFVTQIVGKTGAFLRSARMESLALYRLTERIQEMARNSGLEGVELRRALLKEAHRLQSEA